MAEQHPLGQVFVSHTADRLSPILRLPIDAIAEILANIDNVKALLPAILAHSIFLEAFKTQQHRVLQGILCQQIPTNLCSLAAVVQKTAYPSAQPTHNGISGPTTRSWGEIHRILRGHENPELRHPFKMIAPLTPTIALAMEKTQYMVNYFVSEFINPRAPNDNVTFIECAIGHFKPRDKNHLERALYRYQLCCNIFGHDPIVLSSPLPQPIPRHRLPTEGENRDSKRQVIEYLDYAWSDLANEELAHLLLCVRRKILISKCSPPYRVWIYLLPCLPTYVT